MHRSRAPSIALDRFFVAQFSADCITNMPGFNLRQAQRHSGSPALSRRRLFLAIACQLFLVTSTVCGFFVVHETEYAREFIEAEIASLSRSP
jgi:hypothetical protein